MWHVYAILLTITYIFIIVFTPTNSLTIIKTRIWVAHSDERT